MAWYIIYNLCPCKVDRSYRIVVVCNMSYIDYVTNSLSSLGECSHRFQEVEGAEPGLFNLVPCSISTDRSRVNRVSATQ